MAAVQFTISVKHDPLLETVFAQARKDPKFATSCHLLMESGTAFDMRCEQGKMIVHLSDFLLDDLYKSLGL